MSLFEFRQKSSPYWLSIFAVIMIFISPVVSQPLEWSHDVQTQTMHHHGDSAVAASVHKQELIPSFSSTCHDAARSHNACGYCVLFLHLPSLQPPGGDLMPRIHWRTLRSLESDLPQRISDSLYVFQLARAPPSSPAKHFLPRSQV
ncbi:MULTISPECIES: DUF2946 domain-containing protein [Lonsdalea]|uniref:Uncharacterized protein n=2 Tax=Lonsdalea TaxID=1082702 RepID=A0ACD1JD39_9GAMM|nr:MULTISPECIES: DUF2946 domain-containing protein [Lonsdalea]OSN01693.1 hypothetical protein AU499_05005 [Lonsdalea populi]QPQ25424.1 DUF2946 domain-containing protein [Lonsdalea populi]RAT13202.1 hypothetical protein AU486_14940 [Lonsdalea quercina]RAT13828.1 hypothetical protein AU485_07545 [Lonsdalea quercina]RAT20110.1 hypothetical protein AU487_08990 [Lonsdalea populi]